MAYLIYDIKSLAPDSYPQYFFDANVWIAELKYTASINNDYHEQPYIDFFEAVINLNSITDPKALKKVKNQPKIIVTSMLISEIVNAYMRNIAMKLYFKSLGIDYRTKNFKTDYRQNSAADYEVQLKKLISDFVAFKDYIQLWDDDLKTIDPFTILPTLNADVDFNDFYYYYLFYGKNVPIVTIDNDFIFQDIDIVTANKKLLPLTSIKTTP